MSAYLDLVHKGNMMPGVAIGEGSALVLKGNRFKSVHNFMPGSNCYHLSVNAKGNLQEVLIRI